MATAIGLNFQMNASIHQFQSQMDKVDKTLNEIHKTSKQTASGMKLLAGIEIGKAVLSGISSVVGVMRSAASAATEMFHASREATDAVGKLATSTGMAHEPLQVLTRVADHSGLSATQFGDALQKLSRGLGEAANGTGTTKRALEQLGIPFEDIAGLAPEQQFLKIAAAIGDVEDPTQKATLAADVFGRSGIKLIPMFEDIESNVKGTAEEMLELGQVLSGTQVKNVEAMNDRFSDVMRTVSGLRDQLVANIAPALKRMADDALALVKAFEYNGSTGGQALANYLTEAFLNGAKALAEWAEWILNGLKDFLSGFSSVIGDLLTAMAGLADWIPGVDDATVDSINAAAASAKGFSKTLDDFTFDFSGYVKTAIDSFAESSNEAAENTNKFIDSIGPAATSFEGFMADIKAGGAATKQPLEGLAQAATTAAKAAVNTWAPLNGIETYGSLAVGKMGELAIGLANNAGSNKLTAEEVDKLGKSAKAAAAAMPEPPKSMEISAAEWAKQYGDLEEQAKAILDANQSAKFKQDTINNFLDQWQTQADSLMETYKGMGIASEEQLQKQMALEKEAFKNKLDAMSKHSIGWMQLQAEQNKQAMENWEMPGGGIFGENDQDGIDPATGLPMNENLPIEDGGWQTEMNSELDNQTALLGEINGKLDFATAVIG